MRFTVNGVEYVLEFERNYVKVNAMNGGRRVSRSTYPYTTVYLWKGEDISPWRTYTVGCSHHDQFTHEEGRRNALRMMCKGQDRLPDGSEDPDGMTRQIKAELWKAYLNRK